MDNYNIELCCSIKCKQYYDVDMGITNVLNVANLKTSNTTISNECNKLYKLLFETNICWYHHRRDDIGFELFSIYEILNSYSYLTNNYNYMPILVVQEYLQNLLYHIYTSTK